MSAPFGRGLCPDGALVLRAPLPGYSGASQVLPEKPVRTVLPASGLLWESLGLSPPAALLLGKPCQSRLRAGKHDPRESPVTGLERRGGGGKAGRGWAGRQGHGRARTAVTAGRPRQPYLVTGAICPPAGAASPWARKFSVFAEMVRVIVSVLSRPRGGAARRVAFVGLLSEPVVTFGKLFHTRPCERKVYGRYRQVPTLRVPNNP